VKGISNKFKPLLSSLELLSLNNIKEYFKEEYPSCIYFLVKDKEIVYIGKSCNLLSRINNHCKNKEFDKIFYRPLENYKGIELTKLEKALIRAVRPKYNKENLLNSPFNFQDNAQINKAFGITVLEDYKRGETEFF
jgi:predicted GIY-YIG superfamily endonuclease